MYRKHCPGCQARVSRATQSRAVPIAPFIQDMCCTWDNSTVYRCEGCGTLFSHYAPNGQVSEALYWGYRGRDYTARRLRHEPDYDPEALAAATADPARAERLADAMPGTGTALDYGGDGGLLPETWKRYSYDPSGNDASYDVIPVERLSDHESGCDVVTCLHVLEHLADPLVAVMEAWKLVRPEGRLIVEVPMAGRLLAGMWPSRVHEHVQWFSPAGIDELVGDFGELTFAETYEGPLGLCRWVEVRKV